MASTDLPWLIFGRKARPYALAVSLASLYVAASILINRQDAGDALDDWTGRGLLVGLVALLSFGFLMVGWWARSDRLMCLGLLTSAGVFGARAAFIFADTGDLFALSAWLSTAWVVASAGAYLLEASAPRPDVG